MRGINIHDVFIGLQRTKEIPPLQHNATLYATPPFGGVLICFYSSPGVPRLWRSTAGLPYVAPPGLYARLAALATRQMPI